MNIAEFKAQLQYGGQRANRFRVTLTNPADSAGDSISPFMIESTTLPFRTQEAIVQYYQGRQIKLNGNVTYPDWTTNVITDGNHILRDTLENWCNSMNGYETNVNKFASIEPTFYKSTAVVDLLDVKDNIVRSYELIGAFPIEVGGPELTWESNELMKFPVTWTYDYFVIGAAGTTGDAGGV